MKLVLLCGGVGKRMFPITEDKLLLKFLGKTLLEHQIKAAKGAGLSDFVFIGNPQNIDKIGEIVKRISDIKFELAIQKEPKGIADALISAERFLNEEILLQSSNDLLETSAYTSLLKAGRQSSATSHLLGYEVEDYFPGGYLVVDEEGNLKHIVEKPGKGKEPSKLVNILTHLHTEPKQLLKYIERVETPRDDVYECALDSMAKEGQRIKIFPYTGFWIPIKYPWHIFSVMKRFLNQSEGYISSSASISEKAVVEGKVILDDNVRILENAVIRGPVYIGPNTVIGNNSLIRDYTCLGENCVVGYSTEIKNSYIGGNSWFHMSYIGDSIIGDGCSFGAGTVLSNLRFDEKNIPIKIGDELIDTGRPKLGAIVGDHSKTGVNVSVMPGVRIGPNSIVGSHACLTRDLEPGKFILSEPSYKIIENRFKSGEERGRR